MKPITILLLFIGGNIIAQNTPQEIVLKKETGNNSYMSNSYEYLDLYSMGFLKVNGLAISYITNNAEQKWEMTLKHDLKKSSNLNDHFFYASNNFIYVVCYEAEKESKNNPKTVGDDWDLCRNYYSKNIRYTVYQID